MSKRQITIWIIFLLLMLSITNVFKPIIQNDTFYLIKLGDYISHYGIDLKDHFSWITGLSYTYPHWLHSVFIYFIYNNLGFDGLYLYNIITLFSLSLSIYYINNKITNNKPLSLFISIISFPLLNNFISPRSISISMILFLWEIYYIIKLINTNQKKYIIMLTIGSLLLANIHGTIWIMYFILFLPFLVNEIIYQILKKKKIKSQIIEKTDNIKSLLIAFSLSFIMGLLTPSRICYTYFFRTILGPSMSFIKEHLPLIIINNPPIIIFIIILFFIRKKIKLHELFMISGLLLMAFSSVRHLIFIYTIGILYLSIIISRDNQSKLNQIFTFLYNKLFSNKLYPLVFIFLSCFTVTITLSNNIKYDYISKEDYPMDAIEYIKNNLDYENIKIFNHYNDGSYLLFNDIKVFIDSRSDLYMKEFNNTNIMNDYLTIINNYEYEKIFDKYNVEYILLKKTYPLHHILNKDQNYQTIYQDDYYIIYKKNKNI